MKLTDLLSVPRNWSSQGQQEIYEVEISCGSEYQKAKNELQGIPLLKLNRITKVQCPYLYHRYQLRKEEYEARKISFREATLLHATAASKINSILKDNLDWRLVNRAKYGKGVSFSGSASYANQECSRGNGYNRAIIIAKVLVGQRSRGSYGHNLPEDGYDTTGSGNNNVYVKYYDDEFYPEYICYYNL